MTKYISGDKQNLMRCISCKYHGDNNECKGEDSDHYGHLLVKWHFACGEFKPIKAGDYE